MVTVIMYTREQDKSEALDLGLMLNGGLYLFPESGQTIKNLKFLAEAYMSVDQDVVLVTHSLFLVRELEIQSKRLGKKVYWVNFDTAGRYFHSDDISKVGAISILDEELAQSDRYLDLNNA